MKLMLLTLLATFLLQAEPLRVLTYNVRYPNPNDGPDVWEKRRDLFIDSIRQMQPDVIGTQELFKLQGDYLVQQLPEFAWFGTSRRGNHEDEHMGVFYRKNKLKLVKQGQFWLSETPDVVGSQSWNMTLPRMVTWGLFETGGKRFFLLNTHFAHRREDGQARVNSAGVIASRLKSLEPGIPILLTGDFNAPAGSAVYKAMLATGLQDTRMLAATKAGPEDTFHGFRGAPRPGRIDWILASTGCKVPTHETITFHREDRYPSDHFPVLATVELP